MSIYFKFQKEIKVADVFDGRFEKFGFREHLAKEPDPHSRWLSDGVNAVCIINYNGIVVQINKYAGVGHPTHILRALEKEFDTEIFSENEPQYWGFDTIEEWMAWRRNGATTPF